MIEFIYDLFKKKEKDEKIDVNAIINNIILDKISMIEMEIQQNRKDNCYNEKDISNLMSILNQNIDETKNQLEVQQKKHNEQMKIMLDIIKKQQKKINNLQEQNNILNEKQDEIVNFVLKKN